MREFASLHDANQMYVRFDKNRQLRRIFDRAVRNNIRQLKDRGAIVRHGLNKTGWWEVNR